MMINCILGKEASTRAKFLDYATAESRAKI